MAYFRNRSEIAGKISSPARTYPSRGAEYDIGGFRYSGTRDGKPIISVQADRFLIQKKKLGVFRFGLMSEARFQNATVDLYRNSLFPGNIENEQSVTGHGTRLPEAAFSNAFSKETLPSLLSRQHITTILMEPVCVKLHGKDDSITRITASSGTVRPVKQTLVFEGGVRVTAGPRILTADRLTVLTDKALLIADRQVVLTAPDRNRQGQHLTVDIDLRPAGVNL